MTCPPHRWQIEDPNGPTVQATCKLCGAKRVYRTAYKHSYGAYEPNYRGTPIRKREIKCD